jgi:transposase InsO family protein
VKTLMKRMGIEALYRRPRTTKPAPGHKIYPYLLRGMEIVRPNQAWAMDITYIPMARGFGEIVQTTGTTFQNKGTSEANRALLLLRANLLAPRTSVFVFP